MHKEERSTYKAKEAVLLHCGAANLDHDDGEPATILTLEIDDEIYPLVIDLKDTRKLVVRLLVSLHTAEDEFATEVLSEMFPLDEEGNPHWPSAS